MLNWRGISLKDYLGPQLLQIVEKIGKDGRNADETQTHSPRAGWAAPGRSQHLIQFRAKGSGSLLKSELAMRN